MNSFRIKSLVMTLLLSAALLPGQATAQTQSVAASGLSLPAHLTFTPRGNLLVTGAEAAPNSGYVAWVQRSGGLHHPVLAGLPSGVSVAGHPSGPTGLSLEDDKLSCRFGAERWNDFLEKGRGRRGRGQTLFLLIGAGDSVRPGPTPGTEIPNPQGPSSPILSSLLVVRFDTDVDELASAFTLTRDDHFKLADGVPVALTNVGGARASIEVLADFRDYLPDPRMIVRSANPFGLARVGQTLYVADASSNTVIKVDADTGRARTLTRFGPLANPTPVGPPMIDPVPDSISVYGDKLLISFLSGFPFPPQATRVVIVDRKTGATQPFITGLTSAIDVLPFGDRHDRSQFLVLEFSTNQLAGEPGALLRFTAPDATPQIVADTLVSPTNVIRDPRTGELFITEIFTGRIIRIQE
jgi:hypothetical protein